MTHKRLETGMAGFIFHFLILFYLIQVREAALSPNCSTANSDSSYTLHCQFPVNVNTTRRDFSLFFDPEGGIQDRLLDCRWLDGTHFYCFNLEGVTCWQPVSSEAYVTVPERIACSSGRYSAKILGNSDVRDTNCRYVTVPEDQLNLKPPPTNITEASPKADDDEEISSVTLIAIILPVITAVVVAAIIVAVKYRNGIKHCLQRLKPGKQREHQGEKIYSSVPASESPEP